MNFIAFAIPGLIAAIALALVPVKHASKASNEIQAEVEPQTNVSVNIKQKISALGEWNSFGFMLNKN